MVLKRGQGYNCDFPWTFSQSLSHLSICGPMEANGCRHGRSPSSLRHWMTRRRPFTPGKWAVRSIGSCVCPRGFAIERIEQQAHALPARPLTLVPAILNASPHTRPFRWSDSDLLRQRNRRAAGHSSGAAALFAAYSASTSAPAAQPHRVQSRTSGVFARSQAFGIERIAGAPGHSSGTAVLSAAYSASTSASASAGEGGLQSLHAPRPSKMASRTVSERRLDWLPQTCTA